MTIKIGVMHFLSQSEESKNEKIFKILTVSERNKYYYMRRINYIFTNTSK